MKNAHTFIHKADLYALYQSLIQTMQQPPPAGSRPLVINGFAAGWAIPAATKVLEALPSTIITDNAVQLHLPSESPKMVNQGLATVANALRDAGCIGEWRDELIEVWAAQHCIGAIERAAVRPLGLLTSAVHLNAWSKDGRLWIARRADHKPTNPGLWDTLVGGLVAADEGLELGLLRESEEEAGLSSDALTERQALRHCARLHMQLPEGYQVEDLWVSDCVLSPTLTPRNQDGEVAEIRLAGLDEVMALIQDQRFTKEAQLIILDSLRRRQPSHN